MRFRSSGRASLQVSIVWITYALRDVIDLDDASISFLCASLYEYMSKQADCFQIFAQKFLSENDNIVQSLTR